MLRAYKQLYQEVEQLSRELDQNERSPRGTHASPVLSLKVMKLLGMVDVDLAALRRSAEDGLDPSNFFSSLPMTPDSRSEPPRHKTVGLPLKAMKTLGMLEEPGHDGKRIRMSTSANALRTREEKASIIRPQTTEEQSLALILSRKQQKADKSSSSEVSPPHPESPESPIRTNRSRTLSKEIARSSFDEENSPRERRSRRSRTLSKGC